MEGCVLALSPPVTVHKIISCIICKQAQTEPLVLKCYNIVLVCKVCMQVWVLHSHTFPQCQKGKSSLDKDGTKVNH